MVTSRRQPAATSQGLMYYQVLGSRIYCNLSAPHLLHVQYAKHTNRGRPGCLPECSSCIGDEAKRCHIRERVYTHQEQRNSSRGYLPLQICAARGLSGLWVFNEGRYKRPEPNCSRYRCWKQKLEIGPHLGVRQ